MDFAALAALPLNVLAIVAVLYVFGLLIKWAEAERTRIQKDNALKHWVLRITAATLANCVEMLPVLHPPAEEKTSGSGGEDVPGTATTAATNTSRGQITETILNRTKLASIITSFIKVTGPTAPATPTQPPDSDQDTDTDTNTEGDYVIGHNYLGDPELAGKLHDFGWQRSGYIFALIREVEAIYGLCAKANGENNDRKQADALAGTLHALQFAVLRAAIAAKAVLDPGFRRRLQRAVGTGWFDRRSDQARAEEIYRLARTGISSTMTLYEIKVDEDRKLVSAPIDLSDVSPATLGLTLFREIDVRPNTANPARGYLVIALPILAVLALIAVPPVRGFLFPDQISCTTKIASATGAVETTCSHSPATLAEGLAAGAPAPSPEP